MARTILAIFVFTLTTAIATDRTPERFALDFARANGLSEAGQRAEAVALYESLVKERPKFGELNFHYGTTLYMLSVTSELPPDKANDMRLRARAALLEAKSAGFQDPLLDQFLLAIKPDGSTNKPKYSQSPAAESAMHEAEAAFAKRNLDAAFVAYQRALKIEPKLYSAALFSGDCLFVAGKLDEAIVWFRQASEIDPDQESAYRYWADALAKQGKVREALVQLTEALVANPYSGYAWRNINTIATPAGRLRTLPKFRAPVAAISWKDGAKKADLTLAKDFNPFDIVYGGARLEWTDKQFAKTYPGQKYRHSLPEEVAALRGVLAVAAELKQAPKPDAKISDALSEMKPAIDFLAQLQSEDLLEPYVLFLRADDGIAQDYASYRATHREKLREFVRRYLVNLD
ncbi:MAG: tetratricopeptide repeat protein [Opitutae bacterium]|nr:tetratricopeptide repeat protein [Opitutae bacterium]